MTALSYFRFCRKRSNFEKVTHCGNPDWTAESNKELLRAMMMTACDVAAITKPWAIQQQVSPIDFIREPPRVMNFTFLLRPHQKYYITQYGELGFFIALLT